MLMRKVDLCKGESHHEKKYLGLIGWECDYLPCQEQRNKLKGEMKGIEINNSAQSQHQQQNKRNKKITITLTLIMTIE